MGIYIHIPFCKTRCTYCNFYTIVNGEQMDPFTDAVCREAEIRRSEINRAVKTIYFGGGTPSRLSKKNFEQIFEALYANYNIDDSAEITVEANPDDLSTEYIKMLADLPVNRLSIGIQSFDDRELKFLSRRHTSRQAIDAVINAHKFGFDNISIDLMYGLPNQTMYIWQDNLRKATSLNVKHLSAYHLIYEEKTAMHYMLQKGKIKEIDEELSNKMFSALRNRMIKHGFIHYEVTAFGKEGFFSRHNSSYWKSTEYMGLGPAAHSFDGNNRSWNIASLGRYMKGIMSGSPERESEQLSRHEKYNEYILTGLRTMWGINENELRTRFGDELHNYFLESINRYIKSGFISIEDNIVKLNPPGIFIADGIISDLMKV